jgi:sugar phosphate isomerase/epimerase
MRLRHPDGQPVHLSYCTNVHPAEDLPGILAQLDLYAVAVRERLNAGVLGLGLWLSAPVAAELAGEPARRRWLRRELYLRGLEVVTLNGFPYRHFQAPVVKYAVYQPDWTSRRRLAYTLDLARILADLLPDGAAGGSVSTLPFGWRQGWSPDAAAVAARHLDELAAGLARLAADSGRPVRVGLEPEPGCVLETVTQAAAALRGADHEWLGICLDLAHLACAWEDPDTAVAELEAAGVPVVKVQVSAALEVADPAAAGEQLRRYAEPRFLHQTRSQRGGRADDLGPALAAGFPGPWRVHFHLPLHAAPQPPLRSTVDVVRGGLRALLGGDRARTTHLEVETYTWDVLPADQRPRTAAALAAGLAAELAFTRDVLCGQGLAPLAGARG